MHKLLELVIMEPRRIQTELADDPSPLAMQMIALTKLSPYDLFLAIVNSYFHHMEGEAIAETIIMDKELVSGFRCIDDLYYQVAELYKAATGKVPEVRKTRPSLSDGGTAVAIGPNELGGDDERAAAPVGVKAVSAKGTQVHPPTMGGNVGRESQTAILSQPLKWFGGKFYLASRIAALMPRHLHYVEPYFGGGAVLLGRDPDDSRLWLPGHKGVSEVANDINGRLVNFWRVLRDPDLFPQFCRIVQAVPMARVEWEQAHSHEHGADPVANAVAFFVDCRQSRAGNMKGFTSITRTRTRRQLNGNVSEWLGAVDGLPAVHARLRRVLIENLPAVELIRREDSPGTLFYCDPPYMHETRATPNGYAYEMTVADHQELLATLLQCQGKVMLSGYPSDLYDRALAGWTRHAFDLPNNAAGGAEKRRQTEVLWCNFG